MDLAFIWAGIIAFAVLAYLELDGFDLGVGILLSVVGRHHRDQAANTIAPFWDGNETWLVLGGGGLFAAFPLAYAVVLPALYAPLTAMLLALVFRGVAFEFRWRTTRWKGFWDLSLFLGSLLGTFFQGIVLGALVQGIEVENRAYAGGWYDWLTPFSLFTGLALVFGYTLLGAGWLILKTADDLRDIGYRWAWRSGAATLVAIVGVSLWTPLLVESYWDHWFSWPNIAFFSPVPILVALTGLWLFAGIARRQDNWPFPAGLCLFILSFAGIGISFYPHIVPPALTIEEAAAPDESLWFLLIGALVLIPMTLAYTAFGYWTFRGKVEPDAGYH